MIASIANLRLGAGGSPAVEDEDPRRRGSYTPLNQLALDGALVDPAIAREPRPSFTTLGAICLMRPKRSSVDTWRSFP